MPMFQVAAARVNAFVLRLREPRTWRVTGEFVWVMAGQAGALLGSVALTKVLTSTLGIEQYGRFALGMTVAVLLNQLVFGPITVAGIRYFSAYRDSGRAKPFMSALSRLTRAAAALVGAVALIVVPIVYWRFGIEWAALIGLAASYGVVQNVFALFNGLDAAARDRASVAIHQAVDPAFRLVMAVGALWLLSRAAWSAMLGVTAAMCLTLVSQRARFLRSAVAAAPPVGMAVADATPRPDNETDAAVRTLITYSKFFVLSGIFTSLQLASDRWALKIFLDDAAVGIYAAAFQLASVPSIVFAGCLSQFFSPIVFQRAQDGTSPAGLRRAGRAILAGTMVLSLLVAGSTLVAAIVGEPLIVLFTSRAYQASGPYLAPLVLGLGLLQIGHMLSLVPMSSNRLKGHLAVKIIHGVSATALNIVGARQYGVAGLCGAAVVGGALYVVLVLCNNARLARSFAVVPLRQLHVEPPV